LLNLTAPQPRPYTYDMPINQPADEPRFAHPDRSHVIMKTRNAILAALAAAVVISILTGYFAHEAGYRTALGLKKSSLVGTLDGLERIRGGDAARGTALIEQDCFVSAVQLMGDEHYRSDIDVRGVTPRLISYRHSYRTNQAEWT